MRHFMVLLILLFSSAAPTSAADDSSGDYAKLLNEQNLVFLQDLVKRIEQTGFKDVHVVPQMFFVVAVKPDGTPVRMIVDSDTLKTLEVPERSAEPSH